MLERSEYMPLQFFNKQRWSGSFRGMRFLFQKTKESPSSEEAESVEVLKVVWWKEPYSYECTPEEEKTVRHFPFTEEGREEGILWLEEEYERVFTNHID